MGSTLIRMAAGCAAAVLTAAALAMPAPALARPCLDCEDPELPGPGGPNCPTIAATVDPSITTPGPQQVGRAVVANRGTWSHASSYRVRWFADTQPVTTSVVTAASTVQYVPTAADHGARIRVQVTAVGTDPSCTATEYSAPTDATRAGDAPAPLVAPSVQGDRSVGAVLQALPGSWSPAPDAVAFEWLRGDVAVGTQATYTPSAADANSDLRLVIRASRDGHETGVATVAVGVIAPGPAPAWSGTRPGLSGRDRIGRKIRLGLSAAQVRRTAQAPGADVRFQWLRGGKVLRGQVDRAHRLVKRDRGQRLRVRIVVALPGHDRMVLISKAVMVRNSGRRVRG